MCETFQRIKCEFWDFLYFITYFHENMSWEDAKTHKLVMRDKQPISCAKGEILTKNWNLEHESTSWDFHLGSWRNMFQLNMRCFSWVSYEHVWMKSIVDEFLSWEIDEWKVFEVEKRMLWVDKTSENGWEVWVFILIKVFLLEKLGWNGKTWKFKAKSSFLTKTQVSSHS